MRLINVAIVLLAVGCGPVPLAAAIGVAASTALGHGGGGHSTPATPPLPAGYTGPPPGTKQSFRVTVVNNTFNAIAVHVLAEPGNFGSGTIGLGKWVGGPGGLPQATVDLGFLPSSVTIEGTELRADGSVRALPPLTYTLVNYVDRDYIYAYEYGGFPP